MQPYLENLNVFKYMQAMSKLRMSSHRLAIESGRWTRPNIIPVNERKCTRCKLVEDEYHFILECTIYIDLRKKYIPKYFWKRPSMFKFVELLNTTNMKILRNLRFLITIIIVFSAHKYFIDFFKKMWHVTYQNNP